MSTNSGKLAVGLLLLISIWVGVYWTWEPSKPPITLDPAPSDVVAPQITPPPMIKVEQHPNQPAAADQPRSLAVVPPEFIDYTIQPGDTFESISTRFYASPAHADAITRANGLGDAARLLTPGRTIRIARDPANLQGVPAGGAIPVQVPERTRPPEPPPPPPKVVKEPRHYTVQGGDSLSKIAKKFYNDASQWERIYEANKASMKGPHDLKLGAVLVIPE
jgi:nucleoid-associated protein YgaU